MIRTRCIISLARYPSRNSSIDSADEAKWETLCNACASRSRATGTRTRFYEERSGDCKFQLKRYGHPSEAGFEEVIHSWKAEHRGLIRCWRLHPRQSPRRSGIASPGARRTIQQ